MSQHNGCALISGKQREREKSYNLSSFLFFINLKTGYFELNELSRQFVQFASNLKGLTLN